MINFQFYMLAKIANVYYGPRHKFVKASNQTRKRFHTFFFLFASRCCGMELTTKS